MKTILNYFRQRRERKLRKWCAEQAFKRADSQLSPVNYPFLMKIMYDWIKEKP